MTSNRPETTWSNLIRSVNSTLSNHTADLVVQEFEWLEFFAGYSACTRAVRRAGFLGARFDLNYVKDLKGRKSNWMDLLTPSGFMHLGGNQYTFEFTSLNFSKDKFGISRMGFLC